MIGSDRRIAFVNKAWEDLTGYPAEQVVGLECRPLVELKFGSLDNLGVSFCPPPEAFLGRSVASKTLIVHADGDQRWRILEFWPFHDAQGILSGLIGLVQGLDSSPIAPFSGANRLQIDLLQIREQLQARHGFDSIVGRGSEHRRLLDQMTAASITNIPVLIVGEAGTGKRLVARTIHQRGDRRLTPLLSFDCQAVSPEVLNHQLFGTADPPAGILPTAADGATLLIGDILGLSRDLQARLVASLDGRVRLIALTVSDPDEALSSDQLCPDLYYALTGLVIRLRPLRDRLDEVPLLAQNFVERVNRKGGRYRIGLSPEALRALIAHDWPGNLLELARVIDEAHARGIDSSIQLEDIPGSIRGERGGAYLPPPGASARSIGLKEMMIRVEIRIIEKTLERAGDNKSKAAKMLGVNRPFLYRRIKELGINGDPVPLEKSAESASDELVSGRDDPTP